MTNRWAIIVKWKIHGLSCDFVWIWPLLVFMISVFVQNFGKLKTCFSCQFYLLMWFCKPFIFLCVRIKFFKECVDLWALLILNIMCRFLFVFVKVYESLITHVSERTLQKQKMHLIVTIAFLSFLLFWFLYILHHLCKYNNSMEFSRLHNGSSNSCF